MSSILKSRISFCPIQLKLWGKGIRYIFIFLSIFFVAFQSHATVYYIATAANGGSNSNDGSIGSPWLTLKYALSQATTPGDTVFVTAGTYLETEQIKWPVGVSIMGEGETSVIVSHVTGATEDAGALLFTGNSPQGTNGNQSISYLKFDGDNLTGYSVLRTVNRNNVSVHHCTIVDFEYKGVDFDTSGSAGTYYSTGNSFHDNVTDNCGGLIGGTNARGHLELTGQEGFLCYNNYMTQNRGYGLDGFIIKAVPGYIKGLKIYDNTILRKHHDGVYYGFALEFFAGRGGNEIYNNRIAGEIDFAGIKHNDEGGYGFAWKIYNNDLGYEEYNPNNNVKDYGIQIEGMHSDGVQYEGGFYVYNNTISYVGIGFWTAFNAGWTGMEVKDIYIHNNLLKNIGYTGGNWSFGMYFTAQTGADLTWDNINIWNNTIYSPEVTNINRSGIKLELKGSGGATNINVKNNIIEGFVNDGPIHILNCSIGTINIENNNFYNNGKSNQVLIDGTATVTTLTNQNNITTIPGFVNPGTDFNLAETSNNIDAGIDVGLDFVGTAPDIGAFEFHGNTLSDVEVPVVTNFSIPETSSSLVVSISSFTASDNKAVAGYMLTESGVSPLVGDAGWTTTAPASYTFVSEGTKTLYAWAKDAAGNVSGSASATVTIKLPDLSPAFSEYLFEESSGSAVIDSKCSNDGMLFNEYTRVGGAVGNGIELSGSGYISLGQCFGENVQDEVTLSAWIKPNANSGGYQGIIMHGGPNTDTYALYIYSNTKTIGFKTSGTTSSWFTVQVDNLWDGNWHHIAVVYNDAEKIIYADNVAVATIEASGKIDSGQGYNLLIGAGRDEATPRLLYSGKMDEVRIYNYALTVSEVGDLYHPVNRELNKIYTTEDITICEGEEYMGWTETGRYERVLQRKPESTSGADSIVTTNLTVHPTYHVSYEANICEGETYKFGSQSLTKSGQYTEVFETILGCDSTVTLTLTVGQKYEITEEVTINEGEDYMGWTEEGTYQRNLVSTTGCDSIVVTSLKVMYSSITIKDVEICEGDSYNGWTETGQYESILQSSSGGDSIVITNLTVNPSYTVSEDVSIYEGEDYMGWTEEGTYQRNLVSTTGCDSIVVTRLKVMYSSITIEDVEICEGDSYNGWTETGQYERILQSVSGGDSIVVTHLTVNPVYRITEEVTIYEGDNYFGWTKEGTYQRNLVSIAGCDSIVVTNLSIEKINVEQNAIHTINLAKGWNIISSYLIPSEKNMESVMESLRSDGNLVKVQDESNNTYEQKNRNFPWVNNIGDFLETEGYRVQVNFDCALEIKGQNVSLPFSIPLKGGTNIISFPVNGTVDAMKVIQPLIDAGVLNKVQDEKGNSIENWRNRGWINRIGNFEAGKGYIVQVSSDAMLTINEFYTKSAQVLAENPAPTYFNVNYDGNGIDHMNINITELAHSQLRAGDEIAVFDNGICVGAVKLAEHHFATDAVSIPASANEAGMNNGYSEGHSVELRVWSNELNEEINMSSEVVEGEMVFNKLGSVFVALAKDVSVNTGEQMDFVSGIEVYPNPAQNYVNVRFSSLPDAETRISLFDISGREMLTVEVQSSHEVIHLDNLTSGIYFIKTFANNRTETYKLIKR